jgi:hypothetical protein
VVDLERALLKLDGKRGRDAAELYAFLRRMEGPLLVLWAYLEARFNAKSESPRTACERNALVEEFDAGTVRHDRLVRDFVLEHVEVGPRTAYNLASYYTATQDYGEARLRLEAALELGIFTDAALTDEQLKPLRKADREAFDKLIDVYRARDATGLAAITAIGPELAAKLVAMGLDSAAKVIAAAASAEKRAQLAAQLDIGPGLVERWVRLLAMQQRVRIEARHLNLLEAANVNSLDALRRVTAKRLHELLEAVSGGRDVPKTSALQRWIEHASAAPQ